MLPLLFLGFCFFCLGWLSFSHSAHFRQSSKGVTWMLLKEQLGKLLSWELCPSCFHVMLLPTTQGSENRARPPVPCSLQAQERGWTFCEATGERSGKAMMKSDHWIEPLGAHCWPDGGVRWHNSSNTWLNENENQMGCERAEDRHTTCQKACLWGEGNERINKWNNE